MSDAACLKAICGQLEEVGLPRSGTVLVHSSLSSLGHVPGGARTVIAGIRDALGPEGTLLFPALSYATVNRDNPVFDILKTPSCIGVIPETFRTMPGVMRSVCPTHSVAGIGPLAETLLSQHHLDDTPCGAHSPWRKLPEHGGHILFLGCGLRPNTSMHGIEELAEAPYLFGEMMTYRIVHPDGGQSLQRCRRHNFFGYTQRYDRVAGIHTGGWIAQGPVLEATAHLVQAARLWEEAYAVLFRDPYFFVERSE